MTVTAILANIANAANPAAFHGTPETGWPRELKSTPRVRARQLPSRCRLFTYFFFLTAVYRARVDGSPITSFTLVTVDVSAFPLPAARRRLQRFRYQYGAINDRVDGIRERSHASRSDAFIQRGRDCRIIRGLPCVTTALT